MESLCPEEPRPFIWIQQVKANVVSSFLYEEFLGFCFIVQNNHLARAPLKRSGGLIMRTPQDTTPSDGSFLPQLSCLPATGEVAPNLGWWLAQGYSAFTLCTIPLSVAMGQKGQWGNR